MVLQEKSREYLLRNQVNDKTFFNCLAFVFIWM